jgi:hypothetical protein
MRPRADISGRITEKFPVEISALVAAAAKQKRIAALLPRTDKPPTYTALGDIADSPPDGSPSKLCATLDSSRRLRMEMTATPPLVALSKQAPTALMPFGEYVDSVADAFRPLAQADRFRLGRCTFPPRAGGFHVNAGSLPIGPATAVAARYLVRGESQVAPGSLSLHAPPALPRR